MLVWSCSKNEEIRRGRGRFNIVENKGKKNNMKNWVS